MHLNASMSIMMNVDWDVGVGNNVMCNINQIVFKHKGLQDDLMCKKVEPVGFSCYLYDIHAEPICKPLERGLGQSWSDCNKSCNKQQKFSCEKL